MGKAALSTGTQLGHRLAGGSGLGVIDAAKEAGKYVIGVDSDQSWLGPENVLTSVEKRCDKVIFDVIKKYVNGEFKPGEHEYSLAEGGMGLSKFIDNPKLVSAQMKEKVKKVEREIIGKKIDVLAIINKMKIGK